MRDSFAAPFAHRSVVGEYESVGVNDAERDSGEVMVVERARGGAAGAVNGGVVDAGEADRLGGVAEEAGGGRVAGAGRRSDDEDRLSTGVLLLVCRAVALGAPSVQAEAKEAAAGISSSV